jgi:Flp pilus assembly CpaE family ATPase
MYSSIVLDTSGPYGDWNLAISGLANEVLLVTTNELPSLHATQRALAYLDSNGIERSKIRLVVDRYRPDMGLPQPQLETALHGEVFQVLPSDTDSVHKALLEGRPVLPTSRFGKSVAALVERLAGQDPSRRRTLLPSGLLKGAGR